MIQRIQSVYLFLAIVAMVLTFFIPVWAWTVGTDAPVSYSLYNYGIETALPGYSAPLFYPFMLCFFAVGSIVLYAWSLFSFKKLGKAIGLLIVALISTACYGGALALIVIDMNNAQQLSGNIPGLGTVFPAIALVLGIMAFRAMRRDQALLRSADRIR